MNKNGLMMIEAIMTLLIILSIIVLTPKINKKICEFKINNFIRILSKDINYSIEYSITHYTIVKIKFYPNEYYYKISDVDLNNIRTFKFDKNLTLNSYITYNTIEITHGNVINYHYFYLTCGNMKYKITVYEKSGIIYALKQ